MPVRLGGPWTREKLAYLQKYANAFMAAMQPKRKAGKWERLVYLDLLAGPGIGRDRDAEVEFDGSALIALKVRPPFDRLFLADLSRANVEALKRRIPTEDLGRTDILIGDCNDLMKEVVRQISVRTLGLAFVDPEGFEVRFDTLRTLATRRIDVLLWFPSGIGIARNLRAFAQREHSPMDGFWGGREWRDLPPARLAAGTRLRPEEALTLDRPWVLRFRARMADLGYQFQDEGDPYFVNEKNVPMYHLLFFSRDAAGLTIWRGIKKVEPTGQRRLPLGST